MVCITQTCPKADCAPGETRTRREASGGDADRLSMDPGLLRTLMPPEPLHLDGVGEIEAIPGFPYRSGDASAGIADHVRRTGRSEAEWAVAHGGGSNRDPDNASVDVGLFSFLCDDCVRRPIRSRRISPDAPQPAASFLRDQRGGSCVAALDPSNTGRTRAQHTTGNGIAGR